MRFLNRIGVLNAADLQLQPWWNGRKSQGEPNVAQNVRVTHHAPPGLDGNVLSRYASLSHWSKRYSIIHASSSRYARRMRSFQGSAVLEGVHSHG